MRLPLKRWFSFTKTISCKSLIKALFLIESQFAEPLAMSQDDELSEQQFGMETRKLEIRYRRGIYLIDITPAEGSKSLVASYS